MTKIWCTIILISTSIFSMANEDLKEIKDDNYVIASDVEDASIPEGKFVITGEVRMFSSNLPIENVLVGSLRTGSWIRTDSAGYFYLQMNSRDSTIQFYLAGWSQLRIKDYIFKEQHKITMTVWLHQNKKQNELMRKPIIYLYSDKDLSASIKINPMGELTFTYPEYHDGWKVKVSKDGGLLNESNGKEFPYLFWEAKSKQLFYDSRQGTMDGFFIKTDTTIEFLENKLSTLGLNDIEKTDFITYWGPILAKKEYALVQFVVDDDYEAKIAKIEINPAPTSMRRVFILCSGLDNPSFGMDLKAQELKSFKRKGFTVVEWGGAIIDLEIIKP